MGERDDLTEQQKTVARIDAEYAMDVGMWQELYPWLTWDLVQAAARYLDQNQQGWRGAGVYGDSKLVIETADFLRKEGESILKGHLKSLTDDGEYSEDDHKELIVQASDFGLAEPEINELRLTALNEAIEPIKKRFYETSHVTDEDLKEIEAISRKYHVTLIHDPLVKMCRDIYLMEEKNELPMEPAECANFIPDAGEQVYYAIATRWLQLRSRRKEDAGAAASMLDLKEELRLVASGMLYITSKRLVFNGDYQNTCITLRRLLGTTVFADAIAIEKAAGRSDYFSIEGIYGRYVSALIRLLKVKSV